MSATWAVFDMDEGILRRCGTRGEAVAWLVGAGEGGWSVLRRRRYQPGAYEYHVGVPGQDTGVCAFVERLDTAADPSHSHEWGFWLTVPDKYPYPDRPYAQDVTVDRELLIEQMSQRRRARNRTKGTG